MSAGIVRVEFPPALMTRETAAYYLDMSLRQLDLLKATGEITAHGNSKRVTFTKVELDRYVAELPERTPTGSSE